MVTNYVYILFKDENPVAMEKVRIKANTKDDVEEVNFTIHLKS